MAGRRAMGLVLAGVVMMVAGVVAGQQAPPPAASQPAATQPVLPTGHPAVGGMPAGHPAISGEGPASMPAGHPAVSGTGGGAMPAGHPAVGGAGGGEMPSGHPAVPGMGAGMKGALRVLVTQGTKGGPALGKDEATVELMFRGNVLSTHPAALDEKGKIELKDLPLPSPCQPIITVKHAGSEQQAVGPVMNMSQPAIEMDMKVYETTTEKPAWTIGMRHATVTPMRRPEGLVLRVIEMVGGFNPSDKAWVGEEVGKERRTLTLPLPAGISETVLGQGLLEAGAKVENGSIVRGKTMLPGSTQYVYGYMMPVKGDKATLTFTAAADTSLMAVYVPRVKEIKVTGLEEAVEAKGGPAEGQKYYRAKGMKAGSVATMELSGIEAYVVAAEAAAKTATTIKDAAMQTKVIGPARPEKTK